jgi:glyoxylase-like metal-dependent hydrolase (beta-lactamase superfamily II)
MDAGMGSDGLDIKKALDELKREPKEIKGCILTHWHNDHSGGAFFIEKNSKAKIYCSRYEGSKLITDYKRNWKNILSEKIPEAGPLILFKGLLKDGPAIKINHFEEIQDGDLLFDQFKIINTYGHTPGHISIYDTVNKVLFAGDAIAVVDKNLRRMARPVTEDLNEAFTSMKKFRELDVKIICPGHRSPLNNDDNQLRSFVGNLAEEHWPLFG